MKLAVIGLGYVGAPLAIELAKHFPVIGYDLNAIRVKQLKQQLDSTNELSPAQLATTTACFTDQLQDLATADIYIVTVPTPIKEGNVPDLDPVKSATKSLAPLLKNRDLVIYESTVYPGVTEEVCVPLLEQGSGLKWQKNFSVGYSPERINPGDRLHTLATTTKVVAGDSPATLDRVDFIYSKLTRTYRASSIKVAEGAKVIENIQRDVNIALMNELAQVFSKLELDTNDVIDAAASKWNFQAFRPGLVGGHCISVDPYYLSHQAATHGFVADVILSARAVNDSMATFVVDQLIKLMARNRMLGASPVVTVLGCTFKENVPDIRNSKVFQLVSGLKQYGIEVQVVDPRADALVVLNEAGIELCNAPQPADAVVLAVPHEELIKGGWSSIVCLGKGAAHQLVVMDLRGVLDRARQPENVDLWRP